MNNILKQIKKTKEVSYHLVNIDENKRIKILNELADSLRVLKQDIINENQKDLALMSFYDPKYDRLLLSENRILSMANEVQLVASLPNVLEKVIEEKIRKDGLVLKKISVPLGVVAIIYESRPNVTIDVFSLCFKSGNACILKGGKEAYHSNKILVEIIKKILINNNINPEVIYLMPSEREAVNILLNAVGFVDVCLARGSQALINFVRDEAKIPVIETGAGIVHAFFDLSGDLIKGMNIIENSKIRRVSVCNALDCLIIHEGRLENLGDLIKPLAEKKVEVFADQESYKILEGGYPKGLLKNANDDDFGREFLSYKISIKTVKSFRQAVEHISIHTSGHSEAIISEDQISIDYFLKNVDAAALYVNASTAFTDGNQFGMGAEVGISTQKLHVRGPIGLESLTSYKWLIFGDGHVRD